MTKRFRVGGEEVEMESINMANMLMFLSHSAHHQQHHHQQQQQQSNYKSMSTSSTTGKLFECKTCNRRFTSFQALGGHRASHKKPKAVADGGSGNGGEMAVKPKVHECSVCGLEFAIGQALGGHMRRHRGLSTEGVNGHDDEHDVHKLVVEKKSHGGRRVMCMDFDLNLPPVDGGEHDQKWLKIGSSNLVDCLH